MLFIINEIRVDFVLYPFPWKYAFVHQDGIRLAAIEDIIPMKLQAAENRKSKKDIWDLEVILQHFTVEEMMSIFQKKFENIDTGFLIHNILDFENADQQMDPDTIIPKSWEVVKSSIVTKVTDYVNRQIQ